MSSLHKVEIMFVSLIHCLWYPLESTPATPPHAEEPRTRRRAPLAIRAELASLVFSVCAVTVAVKSILMPRLPDVEGLALVLRILGCCAEDFAVGLACLLILSLAFAVVRSGTVRGGLRVAVYLATLAAVVYLAANIFVFFHMRTFLTSNLFHIGGGFSPHEYVTQKLDATVQATLVFLPLLVFTLHLCGLRWLPRLWNGLGTLLARPALLLLLIGGCWYGAGACRALSSEGVSTEELTRNPHLLMVRSLAGGTLSEEVEPLATDTADFLPDQARPSQGLFPRRPRNIVLIILESLSASTLSLYGSPLPTTPQLQTLLQPKDPAQRKGIVFDRCYATTNHSMGSALPLLGSMWNVPYSVSSITAHRPFPIPAASLWLRQHGYKTYFIASGGSLWDSYLEMASLLVPGYYDVGRDETHPFWKNSPAPARFRGDNYSDDDAFADAERAIQDARGEKFCLVLWACDAHWPFREGDGPEFDQRWFPRSLALVQERLDEYPRYLRCVWRLDARLAAFYRALEKSGLADDTLVVVVSDHGEAFGQHGFFFHGITLYEEDVHVPLLMLHPSLVPLGPRLPVLGSHVDLWPTILDVCGLPTDPRWQGRSLFGISAQEPRQVYFHSAHGPIGLRTGSRKYLYDTVRQRESVFDLEADPRERRNLAAEHPDFCLEARRRLTAWTRYQTQFIHDYLRDSAAGPPATTPR